MPLKRNESLDIYGRSPSQRKDQISHFILRLAYCRTEELRRWFINNEVLLLKYRLDALGTEEMHNFMIYNNMNYDMITMEEKQLLLDKLISQEIKDFNVLSTIFYK